MVRPKIAVIGAGLSGALTAYYLSSIADVVVFEKSRGVGGRLARTSIDGRSFNLGAQFVSDHPLIPQDLLLAPVHGLWLSYPVNQLIHLLLDKSSIQVQTNSLVTDIRIERDDLLIEVNKEIIKFDHVISSVPAMQAKELFYQITPQLDFSGIEYQSIMTLFLTNLSEKLKEDAYEISWVDGLWRVLILSDANDFLEMNELMRQQFLESKYDVEFKKIHFWRYGYVKRKKEFRDKIICDGKVGFVGDWVTLGPGFYSVFESVQYILESFYQEYPSI